MAFDKLDVELAGLVRVIITVQVELVWVHTQQLLMVKVDGSFC